MARCLRSIWRVWKKQSEPTFRSSSLKTRHFKKNTSSTLNLRSKVLKLSCPHNRGQTLWSLKRSTWTYLSTTLCIESCSALKIARSTAKSGVYKSFAPYLSFTTISTSYQGTSLLSCVHWKRRPKLTQRTFNYSSDLSLSKERKSSQVLSSHTTTDSCCGSLKWTQTSWKTRIVCCKIKLLWRFEPRWFKPVYS